MPETICRRCGSDLTEGTTHCSLCDQMLTLACPSCGYVSDSKVHADCRTAEAFVC
ncbi:MAG TPA: zinc ribbon domain-containing protein [Nitrososphaera sp.]